MVGKRDKSRMWRGGLGGKKKGNHWRGTPQKRGGLRRYLVDLRYSEGEANFPIEAKKKR